MQRWSADQKNMTLRLSAVPADELEAVARAEGMSVSDAVREAIAEHIDRKRKSEACRGGRVTIGCGRGVRVCSVVVVS